MDLLNQFLDIQTMINAIYMYACVFKDLYSVVDKYKSKFRDVIRLDKAIATFS